MYELSAIILVLLGLPLVFLLPFVARRPLPRRLLRRALLTFERAPRRAAFYPLEPQDGGEPSETDIRRRCAVQGAVLCAVVVLALLSVTMPGEGSKLYLAVRNTLLFGIVLGALALFLQRWLREAHTATRCGRLLDGIGLSGMWVTDPVEDELSFRNALIDGVHRHQRLDVVGCSGLTLLRALSEPNLEPLSAPHSVLKSAKVRLLLVPPRSRKIDPERQRSTCAESAIARLERRPEQHWRDLQSALEVRERWANEFGVSLEVRFLEDRPAFQALIVGPQAWFRPWAASGNSWIEVTGVGRSAPLHLVVSDTFANAWANASETLSVSLAAGPTGSFFVREGVAVDGAATPAPVPSA